MQIFYDMDEVLNFMSKSAIASYNKDFDDDFDWRDNKSWFWSDAPKSNQAYFENLMNQPGFFIDCEPQLDGIKYMEMLIEEGYDIRIATQPQWNGLCVVEKEEWIKRHSPKFNIKNTIMIHDKSLLAKPGRILLDDNIDHLTRWRDNGGTAVAFHHPFNKDWDGLRVYSHEEFYNLIKTME